MLFIYRLAEELSLNYYRKLMKLNANNRNYSAILATLQIARMAE